MTDRLADKKKKKQCKMERQTEKDVYRETDSESPIRAIKQVA